MFWGNDESLRLTRVGVPSPPKPGRDGIVLAVISSTLVVQVQGKVCHLLLVGLQGKVGASLSNDNRESVAIAWVGTAAVALLVQVSK